MRCNREEEEEEQQKRHYRNLNRPFRFGWDDKLTGFWPVQSELKRKRSPSLMGEVREMVADFGDGQFGDGWLVAGAVKMH